MQGDFPKAKFFYVLRNEIFYELRNEIFIFLKKENHALATTFEDEVFLTQLAYLCNIFSKLNQLIISLQEKETHLLQLHDKITAFKRNL